MSNTKFNAGQDVVDQSGFKGRIAKVVQYEGRCWYEVRFERGVAVRYDEDLSLQ